MTSMTGYGRHEFQNETLVLSIEIKSYNNRYLDMNLNMPAVLNPLDEDLRGVLKQHARRGKVDVYIRFRRLQQQARVQLDTGLLDGYLQAFQAAAEHMHTADSLQLRDLLQIDGLFTVEEPGDADQLREPVLAAFLTAVQQWKQSRQREGEATAVNIRDQLVRISTAFAAVAERAPQLETRIRETLHERFTEMMGERIDIQRVYAETAVLLVKYSINEELARLDAHIEEFGRMLQSSDAIGKRMDFLCQEMHREMNTIGSKSAMLEISRSVIDMKDALENIREQVRNIE